MDLTSSTYNIDPQNWYKSFPYGFAFTPALGLQEYVWLPISPSNLTTNTPLATNVITTLYGVVEEHSPVRYYDIVISGNTGIAPRYTNNVASRFSGELGFAINNAVSAGKSLLSAQPSVGRKSFDPSFASKLSFGGFLSEATNTAAAIAELALDIGKAATGITPNFTGIVPAESGYVAFHNLDQFFLRYKNDTAPPSKKIPFGPQLPPIPRRSHPLQFLNYKDGIQYDAIPLAFNLARSAENPMLYNYSIRLRCYNLRSIDGGSAGLTQNLLAELGLAGVSGSLFARATSVTNNVATLISGIAGAL